MIEALAFALKTGGAINPCVLVTNWMHRFRLAFALKTGGAINRTLFTTLEPERRLRVRRTKLWLLAHRTHLTQQFRNLRLGVHHQCVDGPFCDLQRCFPSLVLRVQVNP